MGVLKSDLFKDQGRDDPKLEACAKSPAGHIRNGSPPSRGIHVAKIHAALANLHPTGPAISQAELTNMEYGPTTAAAVKAYKIDRNIFNSSYQSAPDDIVGQMTIKKMDDELNGNTGTRDQIADKAFADSRASLRAALRHMQELRRDIGALPPSSDPNSGAAMLALANKHKRNILVISRRLLMVADPSSQTFRDALDKLIGLTESNIRLSKSLLAAGRTGLCDPTHARNALGLPHAWTVASQANPKTHLCEPFFTEDSRDLQRDVVTHECFHILGLADVSPVNTTGDAFRNANTIAQIVAFMSDRFRQLNSDGAELSIPPLPAP